MCYSPPVSDDRWAALCLLFHSLFELGSYFFETALFSYSEENASNSCCNYCTRYSVGRTPRNIGKLCFDDFYDNYQEKIWNTHEYKCGNPSPYGNFLVKIILLTFFVVFFHC